MLDQITDLIREQARSAGNSGRNGQRFVTVDMLQDLPMHWSHALNITSEVHISFHIVRCSFLQQVYNQLKIILHGPSFGK